jgi:hypothetical protein
MGSDHEALLIKTFVTVVIRAIVIDLIIKLKIKIDIRFSKRPERAK